MRCCRSDGGCLALWSRPWGEASNHLQVHWLKTVVLNVVGKGAARSRQVWVGKMSDGRSPLPLTCRKWLRRCQNQGRPIVLGSAWGLPVYRSGGIRRVGRAHYCARPPSEPDVHVPAHPAQASPVKIRRRKHPTLSSSSRVTSTGPFTATFVVASNLPGGADVTSSSSHRLT